MLAVVVAAARVLSSSANNVAATLGFAVGAWRLSFELAPGIGMLVNLYMLCTPLRVAFHMYVRL